MICIFGMIIAFFATLVSTGGPDAGEMFHGLTHPTQLIYIANVATSIATPVAGLFMVLIIWKAELFRGTKNPRVLQVMMTICYLFALYMTLNALIKVQIPNLISIFTGG